MAPYIAFNTGMRAKATNDFEKDLFKLMNNAVFGKKMENLRARCNMDILNTETTKWRKWVCDPSFKGRKVIAESLVIAERATKKLLLNKPVYAGASILDLSKLHMQKFWYDYVRPMYPEAKMLYTDTDSFVYKITRKEMPDFHGKTTESMFDSSGLYKSHPHASNCN